MDLPSGTLPTAWFLLSDLLFGLLLVMVLFTRPWRWLKESQAQHLFLGTAVVLLILWSLRAGISPGLNFHFLGMTAITLMLGWPVAILVGSMALIGVTLNGAAGWEAFGMNALLMVALPVLLTWQLWRWAVRFLPHHFMVYVFVNAFLTSALVMLLFVAGTYPLERLSYEYLPYLPLIVLPEAVMNGMAITLMVAYRPQWLMTFDDARYLKGK